MYFTFSETSNLFLFGQESVAVCSVYNILSGIPICLLHKIAKGYFFIWLSAVVTRIKYGTIVPTIIVTKKRIIRRSLYLFKIRQAYVIRS